MICTDIVAIDPGVSKIATAYVKDGEVFIEKKCVNVPEPLPQRLARLDDWLGEFLSDIQPDFLYLEGFAYSASHKAHDLGAVGGIVRLRAIREYDEGLRVVAPKKIKKLATGKGNASKPQMLAEAVRRLSYAGHDHDEVDARWLLEYAMHEQEHPIRTKLPQTYMEALK